MKRRKIIRNGYRDRRDRELFEAAVSRTAAECLEQSRLRLLASAICLKRLADQVQHLSLEVSEVPKQMLDQLRYQLAPEHSAGKL